MSPSRRIRQTHRKSQPQSPSLSKPCVSGVWHRLLWLAAEREGSARGHKWANKLPTREHTHTHTHTLPLSAPSLRSVYCAQSAAGFNNPRHRSSSSPPRPHLGSSPRAASRHPGREPCFSVQAFRPQIRQEFQPGDHPPQQKTPESPLAFVRISKQGRVVCNYSP